MLGEPLDLMASINTCTFAPETIFAFGMMCYFADSASYLRLVENFTPGRIVHFSNLGFITD